MKIQLALANLILFFIVAAHAAPKDESDHGFLTIFEATAKSTQALRPEVDKMRKEFSSLKVASKNVSGETQEYFDNPAEAARALALLKAHPTTSELTQKLYGLLSQDVPL